MTRTAIDLFYNVALCGDPELTVKKFADAELRSLYAHLAKSEIQTGIPLLVRGLVENEGVERFFKQGGNEA